MINDPSRDLGLVAVAKAFEVPVPLLVEPTPEQAARRAAVLAAAEDAGSSFAYYDRKEDEELPVGAIEAAIQAGDVTREEIADAFLKAMGRA